MRSAWKSDRGVVRENNEDFVLVDEGRGIFLLADGMGGGPAGEVASELAARAAHDAISRELERGSGMQPPRILAEALAAAHSAVAKRAIENPALHGMGTTLDMLLVMGVEGVTCHIGDSRIYKFRQGELRQLTTDDNYAAMVAEVGEIPVEEIPAAYRHILTQAVGVSDQLVPELRDLELKPADLLLLCSDGLTGVLENREIEAIMRLGGEPEEVVEALVAAALERGGPDNVSVLVVEPVAALPAGSLPVPSN